MIKAIKVAVRNGDLEAFKDLLQSKGELEQSEKVLSQALLEASQMGHVEMVRGILGMPAVDINIRFAGFGATPLIDAARNGHVEVTRLLLKALADVNLQENNRRTALIWASRNGYTSVVRLLLKAKGIDFTLQDSHGTTALGYTVERSQFDTFEVLASEMSEEQLQREELIFADSKPLLYRMRQYLTETRERRNLEENLRADEVKLIEDVPRLPLSLVEVDTAGITKLQRWAEDRFKILEDSVAQLCIQVSTLQQQNTKLESENKQLKSRLDRLDIFSNVYFRASDIVSVSGSAERLAQAELEKEAIHRGD